MNRNATDIDGYLAGLPEDARATLEELRRRVRAVAPDAVESISYGMPTFKYQGRPLVYFAAAKNHCAIYGLGLEGHEAELAPYAAARGTLRFPPGQSFPGELLKTLLSERLAAIEAAAPGPKRKKPGAEKSA